MTDASPPSKGWHITLWVLQALLALVFIGSGGMKVLTPYAELVVAPNMGWAQDFPAGFIKFIGAAEVLGGLGLLLPSLTRMMPKLTPLAALGLVVIMLGAAATHVRRGEPTIPPIILAALCGLVVWGRLKKAPIAARQA